MTSLYLEALVFRSIRRFRSSAYAPVSLASFLPWLHATVQPLSARKQKALLSEVRVRLEKIQNCNPLQVGLTLRKDKKLLSVPLA